MWRREVDLVSDRWLVIDRHLVGEASLLEVAPRNGKPAGHVAGMARPFEPPVDRQLAFAERAASRRRRADGDPGILVRESLRVLQKFHTDRPVPGFVRNHSHLRYDYFFVWPARADVSATAR